MTYIVDDIHKLKALCGPHDSYLKEIEKIIGTEIYAKGNELILLNPLKKQEKKFEEVFSYLEDMYNKGRRIDDSVIKTLSQFLEANSDANISEYLEMQISIPSGPTIYPKNRHQSEYFAQMIQKDITFGVGPAGTGKTFLAVAHATQEILDHKRSKLILTRPVVEAGENLGFLPGDLTQKISPYLRPLYDALEMLMPLHTIRKLEENGVIEIAPLAYMRGRNLTNSCIILDEAQNTTKEQMKMFLTRMGVGSKVIVTGDVTQIDLPKPKSSGLVHAVRILHEIQEIGFTYFDAEDVIRHRLIRKIIKAYEKNKNS
ncbi:MAG: PhoH family protein [Spirochaetia bacterium]|nr:PhoH family protein [Spirochaetia bacterium]